MVLTGAASPGGGRGGANNRRILIAVFVCFRCDPAASVLNRVDLPQAAEEHKVVPRVWLPSAAAAMRMRDCARVLCTFSDGYVMP